MNKKNKKRFQWMLSGFGIGVSISVLSWLGISGLLLIIEKSKLPEEELVIFTSLFYGIIFFVALGGVRAESRRHKLLISRRIHGDPPASPTGAKAALNRIKTVLWGIFCVFSMGWVTPALVIYWADPKHTEWAVAACACLSSLWAGVSFVLKRTLNIKTLYNHLMFFIGLCLGAALITGVIV